MVIHWSQSERLLYTEIRVREWHFVKRIKAKISSRDFVCEARYLITEGMLLRGIRDLDVYVCPWRLFLESRAIPTNSRDTREPIPQRFFLKKGKPLNFTNKFVICFLHDGIRICMSKGITNLLWFSGLHT